MSSHVNQGMEQEPRRMFLGFAGLGLIAASSSAIAAGAKAKSKDASNDVSVMQAALALEHEGIAAYRLAGGSGLLKPGILRIAQVFMGHHEQHRDSLASLVAKAGGQAGPAAVGRAVRQCAQPGRAQDRGRRCRSRDKARARSR
jgi:hypothetical protein